MIKNEKQGTLIIGFGNPDRGDDGVAWHILRKIADSFGHSLEDEYLESTILELSNKVHIWFNLQLVPEISEELSKYEKAIFVDAHTGEIKDEISVVAIEPEYQNSPFTHQLTASTCLSLSKSLYGSYPKSMLVSIRGYDFSFTHSLSKQTTKLANRAVEIIKGYL